MINTPFESRMASRDPSRPGSPDRDSNRDSGSSFVKRQSEKIRGLACAILQVSQMLDQKYFKQPLGIFLWFSKNWKNLSMFSRRGWKRQEKAFKRGRKAQKRGRRSHQQRGNSQKRTQRNSHSFARVGKFLDEFYKLRPTFCSPHHFGLFHHLGKVITLFFFSLSPNYRVISLSGLKIDFT